MDHLERLMVVGVVLRRRMSFVTMKMKQSLKWRMS